MTEPPFRFVGIDFDHMHMGDLLRMVHEHPGAEIVGVCDADPARTAAAVRNFGIPPERVFSDWRECLETLRPDAAILCPAVARHVEYVTEIAPYGVHLLLEKPFAMNLDEVDRMLAATEKAGVRFAVNWPSRWSPAQITAHRLLKAGVLGELLEVRYYGGNRGPLFHTADKHETVPTEADKRASWFYSEAAGGGSLRDYLGYGATLGSWFHDGVAPLEVTCTAFVPPGLEVDEHSVTVCRYAQGLSLLETRWGTFTDPWKQQTQPKCGFVLRGTAGTLAAYDYEPTVRLQTHDCPAGRDVPVDVPQAPERNPIEYFVDRVLSGCPFEGPLDSKIGRLGQQIVDSALESIRLGRAVPLLT